MERARRDALPTGSDMILGAMENPPDESQSGTLAEPSSGLVVRLRKGALACYVVFGAGALFFEGFRGFLGLTCSALVVMIGHLWLERIVDRLLRPAPEIRPWSLGVQVFARLVVMGAALGFAIFIARFSPVSVILGFSIIVGSVMIEAVRAAFRAGEVD
ncbi:MAG: ATP synthase subunit I [Thermoanaerobaculia bacterium]